MLFYLIISVRKDMIASRFFISAAGTFKVPDFIFGSLHGQLAMSWQQISHILMCETAIRQTSLRASVFCRLNGLGHNATMTWS